jgi:hypothetical protein
MGLWYGIIHHAYEINDGFNRSIIVQYFTLNIDHSRPIKL